MYSYEEFKGRIVECLEKECPEKKYEIESMPGINRMEEGLVLLTEKDASPFLQLKHLYDIYSITGDMEAVLNIIRGGVDYPGEDLENGVLGSWEMDKTKIFPVVLNKERNLALVSSEGDIYREKLDLLILYYLKLDLLKEGFCSIRISKHFLKVWGVTEEDLYRQCFQNRDYRLLKLADVNILTNQPKYRGAAGMFFSDEVKKFAEKNDCDVFILPSSIHETLLLKSDFGISVQELKQIVRDINSDKDIMTEEDFLSDSIYLYNRNADEIEIVG